MTYFLLFLFAILLVVVLAPIFVTAGRSKNRLDGSTQLPSESRESNRVDTFSRESALNPDHHQLDDEPPIKSRQNE